MEKILLVLNAHKPDMPSIDFACRMATLAGSKLTGLFVENVYESDSPLSLSEGPYFAASERGAATTVSMDVDQAIKLFLDACHRNSIAADVCIDKGEPIQKTLAESRYADLLIVDPKLHFYSSEDQLPSHFTKEVLANAECPVMLAPEKFEEAEEIVFCYDGSASSVFAIKQFTYLLPVFATRKALLLQVNKTENEEPDEGQRSMQEWLRAHYQTVRFQTLKGSAKDELFTFLFMKEKKLVVMGAYGRSLLSTFFKRSSADLLIRTIDLPIFITHQ